ncbi:Toxin-antitoxin system, antitoxin component, Xre family [Bombilactobacillus mellifer]|uniref:Toxin-antitoxin system, antitoxin component, Xre family n=2 Tax=Bombilactobacillus mellifer TaxID=1218492 RepID=A0A0F4LVQ0_9LACO|nr:Toxin-antitoxin system, antitoxin component, Xre family [Bombilactobacillus mellifer]
MMNNYKSPLIKRLNSLFAARDVTPNRVAMLGGMRQSSLSDILIGRTKEPRLDTLQSIARGLGISLTELLDFPPYNQRPDGSSKKEEESRWEKLGNALTADEKERVRKILSDDI